MGGWIGEQPCVEGLGVTDIRKIVYGLPMCCQRLESHSYLGPQNKKLGQQGKGGDIHSSEALSTRRTWICRIRSQGGS